MTNNPTSKFDHDVRIEAHNRMCRLSELQHQREAIIARSAFGFPEGQDMAELIFTKIATQTLEGDVLAKSVLPPEFLEPAPFNTLPLPIRLGRGALLGTIKWPIEDVVREEMTMFQAELDINDLAV